MNEGDFLKVEYTGKAGGVVFDTTNEEEARKAGNYDAKGKYGAALVVVGKSMVVKGLDDVLLKAEVGKEEKVMIPASKAFGERNPQLTKLVSITEFRRKGVEPEVGQVLEFDDVPGRVQSVSGGRVRIDFNHPLAGQELEYSFKVVGKVEANAKSQVQAIAEDAFSKEDLQGITVSAEADSVTIIVGSKVAKESSDFIVRKMRMLNFVKQFTQVKKLEFKEEFELKK